MRRAGAATVLIAAALAAGGCARKPKAEPAPEIVAIKAAGADLARLRQAAAACGAKQAEVRTVENATFLVVGAGDSLAARDCFFERAQADYRANHPVRAWIEDRIG